MNFCRDEDPKLFLLDPNPAQLKKTDSALDPILFKIKKIILIFLVGRYKIRSYKP